MLSLALLTALTIGGLRTLTTASPIAQQITPNTNVPDGYQVGFATVSPCPPIPTPHSARLSFLDSELMLFITTYSKTGSLSANKAPARLAATPAAPQRRSSPPPLDRLQCPPVFTQRPLWDLDPLIALFVEHATASFLRARRTALLMILVAREYHPQIRTSIIFVNVRRADGFCFFLRGV